MKCPPCRATLSTGSGARGPMSPGKSCRYLRNWRGYFLERTTPWPSVNCLSGRGPPGSPTPWEKTTIRCRRFCRNTQRIPGPSGRVTSPTGLIFHFYRLPSEEAGCQVIQFILLLGTNKWVIIEGHIFCVILF